MMTPEIVSRMVEFLEKAIAGEIVVLTFGTTDEERRALNNLEELGGLRKEGHYYRPTLSSEQILASLKGEGSCDDEPPSDERPLGFRT